MDIKSIPLVNGCYIDKNSNMFKVRLLSYSGHRLGHIALEDTLGKVSTLSFEKWQNLRLIPCCRSSNELQKSPSLSL